MGYDSRGYKTKLLTVKKLGWKRIARNTQRFGWILDDATEHTEITETTTYEGRISGNTIYINPRTNRKSKTRVWLSFYRTIQVGAGVGALEFFYNVIYVLRKILAFCFPFLWIGTLIMYITAGTKGNFAEYFYGFLRWSIGCTGGWILGIILEGVFARIAYAVLNKRLNPNSENNNTTHFVAHPRTDKDKNVVVLCDSYNNDHKCRIAGGVNYNGYGYALVEQLDDGNSTMICRVMQDERGREVFDMVTDQKLCNAVMGEYNRQHTEVKDKQTA